MKYEIERFISLKNNINNFKKDRFRKRIKNKSNNTIRRFGVRLDPIIKVKLYWKNSQFKYNGR